MWFWKKKNKETLYKPVYIDVVRAVPYYLDGVDVFDPSKRNLLKKITVRLSKDNVAKATLYKFSGNTRRFKAAIAPLFENIYAVCYLTARSYRAAHSHPEESSRMNRKILYDWCLKRAELKKEEGYIYSPKYEKRATITTDAVTKVEIESLCLFPKITATVPKSPDDVDKFVWIYEHEKTSFYGDKAVALADLENYFSNY